jgi:hypothetical protein
MTLRHLRTTFTVAGERQRADLRPILGRFDPDLGGRLERLREASDEALGVASMEHHGIPIDVPMFEHLRSRWQVIQAALVVAVGAGYGAIDGTTFKRDKFTARLVAHDITSADSMDGASSDAAQVD